MYDRLKFYSRSYAKSAGQLIYDQLCKMYISQSNEAALHRAFLFLFF